MSCKLTKLRKLFLVGGAEIVAFYGLRTGWFGKNPDIVIEKKENYFIDIRHEDYGLFSTLKYRQYFNCNAISSTSDRYECFRFNCSLPDSEFEEMKPTVYFRPIDVKIR